MVVRFELPQNKVGEFSQKWKITEFALFGSVLRDDFRPDSDVDSRSEQAEGQPAQRAKDRSPRRKPWGSITPGRVSPGGAKEIPTCSFAPPGMWRFNSGSLPHSSRCGLRSVAPPGL